MDNIKLYISIVLIIFPSVEDAKHMHITYNTIIRVIYILCMIYYSQISYQISSILLDFVIDKYKNIQIEIVKLNINIVIVNL